MTVRKKGSSQRELIIAKSSTLFWEKGYAETSMRDIAGACGFRPANIYNFFESKEAILYEILYQELAEIVAPIEHLLKDQTVSPADALRRMIDNHVRLTLGREELVQAPVRRGAEKPLPREP